MKEMARSMPILLLALVFLTSLAYGDVPNSFGGTNMGCSVGSSSTLGTKSTGSYTSTSSLNFNSGATMLESVQSSGVSIKDPVYRATSGNNYAELSWDIRGATNPTISGIIGLTSQAPGFVGIEQNYAVSYADEMHFRATAVNGLKYKAEVSTDVIKGGFNKFDHLARASDAEVFAQQTLDKVWGDTITRTLSGNNAGTYSNSKIMTQTFPASARKYDFKDSVRSTGSSITIIPPPQTIPPFPLQPLFPPQPPYMSWPTGPGW